MSTRWVWGDGQPWLPCPDCWPDEPCAECMPYVRRVSVGEPADQAPMGDR